MVKRLSVSTILLALLFALSLAVRTNADDRPARSEDVSIQIIATASNNGEIEECG